MQVDRNYLIAGGVVVALALAGLGYWCFGRPGPAAVASGDCVPKESFEVAASDYSLGKADAPVTIIEYASMTCPHCARFTRDVYPLLKAKYIDKGHVRYVFREFPLDQVALTVSVVGRCLPREQYLSYIEMMYQNLETWVKSEDLRNAIKETARQAGMSGEEFEKCLSTEEDAKKIIATQTQATKDYCIGGTPSFLMDGKMVASGEIPWNELDAKVSEELKKKGVTVAVDSTPAATEGKPAEGATAPAAPGSTPADGAATAPAAATPAPAAAAPPAAEPAKPATEEKKTP